MSSLVESQTEIFLWNGNWVPVESNSSAELMINLFIQNFISFLVLDLVPSGLKGKIKEKPGMVGIEIKDSAGPSWVQKLFCVHISCFYKKALGS